MKYIFYNGKMCPVIKEFTLLEYNRTNGDSYEENVYYMNDGFKMFDKNKNRIFGKFIDVELDGIFSPKTYGYNTGKLFTRTEITLRLDKFKILE